MMPGVYRFADKTLLLPLYSSEARVINSFFVRYRTFLPHLWRASCWFWPVVGRIEAMTEQL
jgi:hypothetical protein